MIDFKIVYDTTEILQSDFKKIDIIDWKIEEPEYNIIVNSDNSRSVLTRGIKPNCRFEIIGLTENEINNFLQLNNQIIILYPDVNDIFEFEMVLSVEPFHYSNLLAYDAINVSLVSPIVGVLIDQEGKIYQNLISLYYGTQHYPTMLNSTTDQNYLTYKI